VPDSMVQQGGDQSGEEDEDVDHATSTVASRTGVSPRCTSTLTSTGPARSGTGEAKTVTPRPLTVCLAMIAPPSAWHQTTASNVNAKKTDCRRGTVIKARIFKARLSPYRKSDKLLVHHHSAHFHGLEDNPNARRVKGCGKHTPWKEGGESPA